MNREAGSKKKPGKATAPGAAAGGEPPPDTAHPEYEIDIFRDWCKGCGICAAFCPRQCLSLDAAGNPVVTNAKRCTGCRWCELHCPDFAICAREVVQGEKTPEA